MPNVAYVRDDVKAARKVWTLIDDCIKGEIAIKAKGEKYLPKPSTEIDPEQGDLRYKAYLLRAMFYNVTGRTLDGLVGQVFSKDTEVEIPEPMAMYIDDIDGAGTSLDQQSKIVMQTTLAKGHGGILSDFPTLEGTATKADLESKRVRPRIINIAPEKIINWRMAPFGGESLLSLLVIEEEKVIADDFECTKEPRWRVYRLISIEGKLAAEVSVWKESSPSDPEYKQGEAYVVESGPSLVKNYSGAYVDRVPFEFVGSMNNEPIIDKPPMQDLASMNIAHYRNSADYEESLFMVGQPTLVISGLNEQWAREFINGKVILGSRSAISLPKECKADMLQPHPNIMPKEGMEHKENQMKALGAKLIEPNFSKVTATEVLMEAASESSILTSTANNVSAAYRKAIANAGQFLGEIKAEDVTFQLNTDYSVSKMTAQERQQLMAEWQGGGITWDEYRDRLREAGIATEDDDVAKTKVVTVEDTSTITKTEV